MAKRALLRLGGKGMVKLSRKADGTVVVNLGLNSYTDIGT